MTLPYGPPIIVRAVRMSFRPRYLWPLLQHCVSFPRLHLLSLVLAAALLLAACQGTVTEIGILEPYQGAALDETRTAFVETLRDAGYKAAEDVRFIRLNAESQDRSLDELARHLVDEEEVDVLFVLSSAALQAAVRVAGERPIVFSFTVRPIVTATASGILPARNLTGALAPPPMAEAVQLIRALLPSATRVGLLFDAGDPDSSEGRDLAQSAARRNGLELVPLALDAPSSASRAAQDLIARGAQAILLSPARLLDQRFEQILRVADAARVPVLGWHEDLTARGALASWGVDYRDHGHRAGDIMVRLLRGESPDQIPVDAETKRLLTLNERVAQRLGITVPESVVVQAARVIR